MSLVGNNAKESLSTVAECTSRIMMELEREKDAKKQRARNVVITGLQTNHDVSDSQLVETRERTIIGSVSYRNRYWVYHIESYRLLLYQPILLHHYRFINCWRSALHTMINGRSSDPRVTRPPRRHACVLFYGPWYGRGLEGRETEGDCNLIPASPWHKDRAVLVLATITPHFLHQQEVITTVSCQSL